MAKMFSIVKMKNRLSQEESIVGYCLGGDDLSRTRILKKLNRSIKAMERDLYSYRMDETLCMHLLPGLSALTVQELSRKLYYTVYVVCKKVGKSEKALFLSLFKDTAMRYLANLPDRMIKDRVSGMDVTNPRLYVKEIRLLL